MKPARILVVDDEPGIRESLAGVLSDEGFEVQTAPTGEDALRLLDQDSFDVMLLDVWLPGIDGLEVSAGWRRPLIHTVRPSS